MGGGESRIDSTERRAAEATAFRRSEPSLHISCFTNDIEIVVDICKCVDIFEGSIDQSHQTRSMDTNAEYRLTDRFLIFCSKVGTCEELAISILQAPHGGRNICCQGLQKLDKMRSGLMNQITWVFP